MLAPSIFENSFMNDFFEDMFRTPFDMMRNVQIPGMKADVQEFDDKYQMDIELPGFTREEIHAAEGGIPLLFLAENHARKETCVCVFFIKNTCIEIMRFYVKRKNAMPARLDRNSGGENYELEYEGSTPETLKTSVEMLITEFSALLPASGKIFFYGGG